MPKYTVSVCNYDMSDTLKKSMRSILEQVGEEFEVLVVDDGSTDNSIEILKGLEKNHENFRYISLPKDSRRRLGKTRNISVQEADGEYVLLQLDADDYYYTGIENFVKVFHQLEKKLILVLQLMKSFILDKSGPPPRTF